MNDEQLFTCSHCQKQKPDSDYYRIKYRGGQRKKQCRACVAVLSKARKVERHAAYAVTAKIYAHKNKEKRRSWTKHWHMKNYERTRLVKITNTRVRRALDRGLLSKAERCAFCGGGSSGTIEAAHEDYNRPFHITWLCRPCHRKWDREQPKTLLCEQKISEICTRRTAPRLPEQCLTT